MFKGLKNAVKGGVSAVTEKGSDLAGSVVGDPDLGTSSLKTKLREGVKGNFKSTSQFVSEGGSELKETVGEDRLEDGKELAKDVAHNVKHYGAFGENFLGYSDPTKDLRKAVKAKEKAAKKAKKEKKKKGGKAEDLFDPENLAKYKAELEEKRRLAAEISPDPTGEGVQSPKGSSPVKSPKFETRRESVDSWGVFDQQVEQKRADSPDFEFDSPPKAGSPVEEKAADWKKGDDWRGQLNSLTTGVDHLLKEKKDKLDQIKVDSYYQRKKTQDEIDDDAKVARPKTLVGRRKKKWVDLDNDEFDENEGEIPIILSDGDDVDSEEEPEKDEIKEPTQVEEAKSEDPEEGAEEEEKELKEDEEEDFFNTDFVNETLAVLDVKLAEIPDSPEDKEDDIFDTKYADLIVEKAEKERKAIEKVESNKIKFGCIANAADVLTGKTTIVDKHNVEHAVKRRSRRANRINLIADEVANVTAAEDIEKSVDSKREDKTDVFSLADPSLPVGDLLTATPSDNLLSTQPTTEGVTTERQLSEELKEFDVVHTKDGSHTSNATLLAAEFNEVESEEEDPFDAAFDAIAKESLLDAQAKDKLAKLEEDLFNDDLFDTTAADDVLNLASLTNVINKKDEEVVLDDFEDKDPFDTSAYEHITKDLEEDLAFESLANRDPHDLGNVAADIGEDPFDVIDKQLACGTDDGGWGAFDQKVERKKPSRPPPRRPPPPPPPPRPPAPLGDAPQVQVDYASGRTTPTVIVKAPSSESIKSWNVNQAETLRLKCNIEAIEASALEEDTEEDPFDTKQFEGIVAELKGKEEDPFDTSAVVNLGPSEIKSLEKDLLNTDSDKSNVDLLSASKEEDPFDTGFVEELLPNKGDPFNTDHISDDDFDPFDTTVADAVIPVRRPKIDQKTSVSIEDNDFDPEASFKTRKAPPPPRPTQPEKETDPFFTEQEKKEPPPPVPVRQPVKPPVINKYARKRPQTLQEKSAIEEAAQARQLELEQELQGLTRSVTDEDFNPREATPPPPKTPTPESPDPFNTDGVDPFDTSAVGITG